MVLRQLMGQLLAIFVVASLVTAPFGKPVAAKMVSSSPTQTASMSADMPCCPDQPAVQPCPDCPLFALCMSKGALSGPLLTNAAPFRASKKTLHGVRDDLVFGGLNRPPPDHPPRSLI